MNTYFLIIRGVYFLSNKIAEGLKSTKIGDVMHTASIHRETEFAFSAGKGEGDYCRLNDLFSV
jgi:hypothetical protein